MAADALFPGSKFILTTRRQEDSARSFINFYSCSILTIIRDDWGYNHSRGRYPSFCASWINIHYSRALAVLNSNISTKSAVAMNDDQLIELIHADRDFTNALCGLFKHGIARSSITSEEDPMTLLRLTRREPHLLNHY